VWSCCETASFQKFDTLKPRTDDLAGHIVSLAVFRVG
jgi:hypothetical protein